MPKLFTIGDLSRLLVLLEVKFPVYISVAWARAYAASRVYGIKEL